MDCKNPACSCPNKACPQHGICCDCIKKHVGLNSLVHCVFPENNGDRSMKNFYNHLKKQFENE